MMKNIGVIIELEGEKIKESNFGMITQARAKDTELTAFVVATDADDLKEDLASFGITRIVDVTLAKDLEDNPDVRAEALVTALTTHDITAVLGLSTSAGKDLLPRIAAKLCAPLVMDCFDFDLEKDLAKTSQYSGKTIATIKLTGKIFVLGVRPNCAEPVKAPCSAQIVKFDGTRIVPKGLKVIKKGSADSATSISLAEADVIIAGGRGMKNAENFSLVFNCAEKLNAAAGASRVAVDSGWVPYSMQVGQTGEKVSPKVYIACGISGSMQHFAGMKTSGMVIAINTDETCAIMSNCDYYVVGDVLLILPELIRALENG